MKIKLTISLFLLLKLSIYSQVKDEARLLKNLESQANKMGQAFIAGDYKSFSNYTYPVILKSMGGANKMVEVLNKTIAEMKDKGMRFENINFGKPSKIAKSDNELQSTIEQHMIVKLRDGKIMSFSTLIAISTDNGESWTFIDTSNKDMATLRKALPNLSPAIIIPPSKPPQRIN